MGMALGHIYQLFEMFSSKTKKLQGLIKDARKTTRMGKKNTKKRGTIKVVFNWYNYDSKKKKFSIIKEVKGGGRRTKNYEQETTLNLIFEDMKSIFFPNEISQKGKLLEFEVKLCDFKLNEIDNQEKSILEYREQHCCKETKLILKTKLLGRFERLQSLSKTTYYSSDEDFAPIKKQVCLSLKFYNNHSYILSQ